MSQPAESAAVPDQLQQLPQGLPSPAPQITSNALPILTPLHDQQPSAQAPEPTSLLPAQAMPQASPRIKPPPSSGSFPHAQAGTPLWQMLGSASNLPGLGAGMFTGKESLDLDVLAKAAVARRKEQVLQAGLPTLPGACWLCPPRLCFENMPCLGQGHLGGVILITSCMAYTLQQAASASHSAQTFLCWSAVIP